MALEPPFLPQWRRASSGAIDRTYDEVLAHPNFAAASRTLGRNMLALAASDPLLDGILKDVGRFAATVFAMYLHVSGGLTLPRLQELCTQTGLTSPGRARAILLYLRFLRYVEPVAGGSKKPQVYTPTASLQHARRSLTRASVDAVRILDPSIGVVADRLVEPKAVDDFMRLESEIGVLLARQGAKDTMLWRVFLTRHAGTQILHALMLGAGDTATYPPDDDIRFSLSALARDFRVSRAHVARILRSAERERFLIRLDENRLCFTPEGRAAAAELLCWRFVILLHAAMRLKDEWDAAGLRAARDSPMMADHQPGVAAL